MHEAPLSVGSILRFGAEVFGDSEVVTLVGRSRRRRRRFSEVATRAARLANALRSLGVEGDQRIATFMWNNCEHLEAYLAIPSMGAVLHPLNVRLFPEQLVYIAKHAEDRVVIVDQSLVPALAAFLDKVPSVHTVLVTGTGDAGALDGCGKQVLSYEVVLAEAQGTFDWSLDIDERDAACICYTSGTTGNPKGVVYSHRSSWLHAMSVCTANTFSIGADDRVMPVVPMFHANAWGLPYASFLSGADLVMPDRFLQAAPIAYLIDKERVTLSAAVPTVWNDLLQLMRSRPRDLSSLRAIISGGSAVPRALIQAYDTELGVTLIQGWGMTECSPVAAVAKPPAGVVGEGAWEISARAGRLLAGVEAKIVDDAGVAKPWDGKSMGELLVRGPWVTSGYYNDADEGAKFEGGWLRTGDVGLIDPEGYIVLTDRSKDVIKSGGEWISSVELEGELMAHPDVLEAAVVGVPDERWQERPLACVVPQPGHDTGLADLRDWLSGRIAKWQLPERWAFVDAVPKTSVGKIDKKALRSAYADGDLDVTTL